GGRQPCHGVITDVDHSPAVRLGDFRPHHDSPRLQLNVLKSQLEQLPVRPYSAEKTEHQKWQEGKILLKCVVKHQLNFVIRNDLNFFLLPLRNLQSKERIVRQIAAFDAEPKDGADKGHG